MKTRTKGFILSFILVFAMLVGVFTMMPMTASAASDTITVGGFPAPQAGQTVEEWWSSISAAPTLTGGVTWMGGEQMLWIEGEYDNVEDAVAALDANGPFEGTFEDGKKYKRITIKTNCGGVVVRDEVLGEEIKTKNQYYIKAGQLAVSKIDARNGAFGIVPPDADGAIITGNFWVYDVNPEVANIQYLVLLLSSNAFVQAWQDCSNGSGNRLYLQEDKFLNYKIPMPIITKQDELMQKHKSYIDACKRNERCNKVSLFPLTFVHLPLCRILAMPAAST